MDRDVNAAALALIKSFEGLRLAAYRDAAGVWTIGYGHTAAAGPPAVYRGQEIDEAEAEAILRADLERFEDQVQRLVTVELNDNEFGALVSLCFNIGAAAFAGSTCLKRLNKGDRKGAAEALTWWNKATVQGRKVRLAGLVRRREAERQLFLAPPEAQVEALEEAQEIASAAQETRRSWLSSRTVAGAAAAAAGAIGTAREAIDSARDAAGQAGGLLTSAAALVTSHPWLCLSVGGCAAGLGLVVWARRDDWLKGLR